MECADACHGRNVSEISRFCAAKEPSKLTMIRVASWETAKGFRGCRGRRGVAAGFEVARSIQKFVPVLSTVGPSQVSVNGQARGFNEFELQEF
jgi:hypothetical protein